MTANQPEDPRIQPFRDMGTMAWDKRLTEIKQAFPSVEQLDWKKAFDADITLLGRILRDLLKSDQATPGRPGPRPSLDRARAEPRLDEWLGKDPTERPYTTLPFCDAFRLLTKRKSLTQVSRKVDMSRTQTFRLLKGDIEPTLPMIEQIAKAYGKAPAWFKEYRVAAITAAIVTALDQKPEQTIKSYEALFRSLYQ